MTTARSRWRRYQRRSNASARPCCRRITRRSWRSCAADTTICRIAKRSPNGARSGAAALAPGGNLMQPGQQGASHATLETENRVLKAQLAAITGEVVRNDSILLKSQQRELEILGAGSLGELLKILIQGLKSSYQLESVVLVLRDTEHEIRHLLWGDPVVQEHRADVRFVDRLSELAPDIHGLP